VFLPGPLVKEMERAGYEIIIQLMSNSVYQEASARAIPPEFNTPGQTDHPLFVAVDFGITRDDGAYRPKLIELQGFPTMFVYQAVLSQQYKEVYDLPRELTSYLNGLNTETYLEMLRNAILGSHNPEEVVLLELDPDQQKTRVDFILTERVCGIRTVNIRDVVKQGRELFRREHGRLVPIRRVYNRAIADELKRSGVHLPFEFTDDLEVEWAGHPNWFFRLSKFSIPFLNHPTVPKTYFLSDLPELPERMEQWVLKPLFSFAGGGVMISPTHHEIESIPPKDRSNYLLQEKIEYDGVVQSPYGGTKVEVRVMYFWPDDRPIAVNNLVRMGRGKMMGVDHNKNMLWVGSSAGFYLP
jgi:hypothetical protein